MKVDLWQGELTVSPSRIATQTLFIPVDYSTVRLDDLCGFVLWWSEWEADFWRQAWTILSSSSVLLCTAGRFLSRNPEVL